MHQRVVFQLELFWETERLNVMEFLLEDLRIDQYGYPLARSLMAAQGQYASKSTNIQV
mgnify:CR=1 FL=1